MAGSGDVSVRLKALEELCGELTTKNRALEEQCAEHRARLETLEGAFAGQNTKKDEEEVKQPAGSANKVTPEDSAIGAAEQGVSSSEQPLLLEAVDQETEQRGDSQFCWVTPLAPLAESIYTEIVLAYGRNMYHSALLCVACMSMQFMFIATVAGIAQDEVGEKMESLRHWGAGFVDEHGMINANAMIGNHTLQAYCDGTAWTWESDAIAEYKEYLEPHWTGFYANTVLKDVVVVRSGILLGSLAMVLWAANCTVELLDIINYVFLLGLPHHELYNGLEDGETKLYGLSPGRKLFIGFIAMCRFVMLGLLAFYGMRFLSFTTNLVDIILNALALTFILDIDELFYKFLDIRKRMSLAALEAPGLLGNIGSVYEVYTRVAEPFSFLCTIIMAGIGISALYKFSDLLEDAGFALCNQVFVEELNKTRFGL